MVNSGEQILVDRAERRQVYRRRDDVVARLAHVDVVIRVNRRAQSTSMAQELVGARCNDFVRVGVGRCPGTGLEDVEYKLIIQLARRDFASSLSNRRRQLGIK